MEYRKYPNKTLRHWLSFPFIWVMIVPSVIFDICLEIYHHICFPLYRIPIVKRSHYIKIDRYRLQYLKWYDKINCIYCGYVNGLMHYAVRIAGDTEIYWCGIRHQPTLNFHEPKHHAGFAAYGDKKAFRKKYCRLKKE